MADGLFVDTWGWCALADRREPFHGDVRELLDHRWRRGQFVATTDYVLDETITLVFRRVSHTTGRRLLSALDASITDGFVQLEPVSIDRFSAAKAMRLKFRERPDISFTDFTSFVVMRELGIREVVTQGGHFVDAGFVTIPSARARRSKARRPRR